MADHDPVTTSLLTVEPSGSFSGEIQFGSAAGGMLALRGPSTPDTQALIFPSETPNNGDYLRANSAGQLYFDAGCSACGGTGGGFTDPGVNGIIVRSGPDTYVSRSIVGTLPITVLNGDGAAGNPTIGLLPGTAPGQVLTWDGTHWFGAASTSTGTGLSGGNPNVLTRWLTSSTLQDSALSQDPTGNTVNAGGDFVVSGKLKANTFLQFGLFTAPPTGPPGLASIYYQGGDTPLWYAASSAPDAAQWRPINAIRLGTSLGAFGPANKVTVGRTGMLTGNLDTTSGAGPFDGEIFLNPLTSSSGDIGKAIVWDGMHWVASPAPIGLAGTGVTVGTGGGAINVFPVWSASNVLINSSPTGTGTAGGLRQGPIGGGSLNYFLQSTYDIFVSDNAIRLGSYLRMDGSFSSVAQSDPGTVRLWYSNTAPDVLQISFHGNQYQAINAIKLAQPGKVGATSSSWVLVPPLTSGRGMVAGVDSIYLSIAPPPVNLTAGQVLTWDGAQWTAAPGGGVTGAVTTPGGNVLGRIPMWTGPNTQSQSSLFNNSTGDISTTEFLTASKGLKTGTNGFFEILAFNLPLGPDGNIKSAGGQARMTFYGGQLLVSLNGNNYTPIVTGSITGVASQAPFTANRLTKWSTAGTSVTDANLFDTGSAIAIGNGIPGSAYQFVPTAGAFVDLGTTSSAFRSLVCTTATVGGLHTLASPSVPGVGGGTLAAPAITLSDPGIGLYATSLNQIVMGVHNRNAMVWQDDPINAIYIWVGSNLRQIEMGGLDPGGSGKHVLVVA